MGHFVLAALGNRAVWIIHRSGHPFVFLILLAAVFLLLTALITMVILHFGKK